MADVRGASGVPIEAAFGGISTPSMCSPLYIDSATGDLYVLIADVVTLVGQVPMNANTVIGEQAMSRHFVVPVDLGDANAQLSNRAFRARDTVPAAVLGDASNVIFNRVFRPGQLPATWS